MIDLKSGRGRVPDGRLVTRPASQIQEPGDRKPPSKTYVGGGFICLNTKATSYVAHLSATHFTLSPSSFLFICRVLRSFLQLGSDFFISYRSGTPLRKKHFKSEAQSVNIPLLRRPLPSFNSRISARMTTSVLQVCCCKSSTACTIDISGYQGLHIVSGLYPRATLQTLCKPESSSHQGTLHYE